MLSDITDEGSGFLWICEDKDKVPIVQLEKTAIVLRKESLKSTAEEILRYNSEKSTTVIYKNLRLTAVCRQL